MNRRNRLFAPILMVFLAGTLLVQPLFATSYISAEPIPSGDVVGADNLAKILNLGYARLELWSNRLLDRCKIADNVIDVLSSNRKISTINRGNISFQVGAGGFEAVTDPSYVFTLQDSGRNGVSAADVAVLDNTLGYVLNQGGTIHFSPDNPRAYDFPLDYAVVSRARYLTGLQAKAFFDYLGTIDPALWSGTNAGFTQIDNSMLFLQPDTSKQEFVSGLYKAANTYAWMTYDTLNKNGKPTTATAGVAFPFNDWTMFPGGDQYLANLGTISPKLARELAALRQQHLDAVAALLKAIKRGNVDKYLEHEFECPR